MGGPVQLEAIQALLRLSHKPDDATAIADDVYVSGAKELIREIDRLSCRTVQLPRMPRVCGLGLPGLSEAEVRLGAWSVLNGRPDVIFDKDPDTLWSRLIHEAQRQIAELPVQRLAGLTRLR